MSWLFDRLCELAVADRIEVILAADVPTDPGDDDAVDLAEVLLRAAQVPALSVTILPVGERSPLPADDAGDEVRVVFATDRLGHGRDLARVARRGLAIAVGGVDPAASIRVDDVRGVTSILDALVTLRYFAFGVVTAR